MGREWFVVFLAAAIVALDLYVFQSVKVIAEGLSGFLRKFIFIGYWSLTAITLGLIVFLTFLGNDYPVRDIRNLAFVWIFIHVLSKIFAVLFVFADDIIRLFKWGFAKIFPVQAEQALPGKPIPRSDFLAKSALVAGAIPALTMGFGILSGAHNYQVRRKTIYLPDLPSAFDGIRIVQLSDMHTGSFLNKKAVEGGISMAMAEKPDVVFVTGDMVNNEAGELAPYMDVYKKIKAPLGVYSTLGNHDYGDYRTWPSAEAKKNNLERLIAAQREFGWDLLLNENRTIKVDGENLGVIGVENWGKGGFHKYGDLDKAYAGMQDVPTKLLLSHDPSHWDAKVRPGFKDINLTFSGHTHGFQFGVEIGSFKWSPVQYVYEQWAGLYEKGGQYLYVNRGFGYIGYPGRIGIWPEITMIELKKGAA